MFSREGVLPDGAASPLLRLFPNVLALADGPAVVTALIAAATALAVLLLVGYRDRAAAVGIWYIGACLFGRNPLIANPSLPFVGWLLLAHALTPPAPWGSVGRARIAGDPGATWRMPPRLQAAAFALMALAYSYSGYTKLASPSWRDGSALRFVLESALARPGWPREVLLALPPALLALATWAALALELGFAPLALVRRFRPLLWTALLSLHVGLIVLIDFADLSVAMVLVHLRTFDPAWVRGSPAPGAGTATIFYDGSCGLCHRFVRFVLSEDAAACFRFAPLDSDACRAAVPADARARAGDTVIVVSERGEVLHHAGAVLYTARRLGGLWGALARLVAPVPRPVLDRLYDFIAGIRHRLFARPADACPILPRELRDRFVDTGHTRAPR
jgi:predicted DCC family thiol-disulfide oxidoreductase YuxK